MKLLYVDIDGPLATEGCSKTLHETKWHNRLYRMNDACVTVLNEILQESGAEIVLSSDWRHHFNLEQIGEIFEWNGIIKKPIAMTGKESISFSNHEKNRIHQIQISLNELQPKNWVVFDDLCLGKECYKDGLDNFVLIDPIVGLTGEGIKNQILTKLHDV